MLHEDCAVKTAPKLWKRLLMWGVFYSTFVAALWALWLIARWVIWKEPTIDVVDVLMYSLGYFFTMVGISAGYHRMLTHGAFKAGPFVEGLLLVMGSMAMQMPPNKWATTHFQHHRHADRDDRDPHSPVVENIPFAHMLWLVSPRENLPIHPKFAKNPVSHFVSQGFAFWVILGLVIPAYIGWLVGGWEGAWSAFFWGGPVRIFFQLHVTWAVNSWGHSWGYRHFNTLDNSRNNLAVAAGTPEGFHNTHHAIPEGANQALRWWEWPFDYSAWLVIWPLEKLGLVWDVKWITAAMVKEAHESIRHRRKAEEEALERILHRRNLELSKVF